MRRISLLCFCVLFALVSEYAACQKANGNGYVAAIPNGKETFAVIKAGQIDTTRPAMLSGAWVPWYTIHKELAGLIDVHHYCQNDEALRVARALADWADDEVSGLSYDQMQHMLETEHGGMTEALANLYCITGEQKYLALAEKFRHDKFFLPFAEGRDVLTGFHANTQIPKFTGYQRVYELTGDAQWDAAAENFWKAVTSTRSWVIGGTGEHEDFFAPDRFEAQMTDTVGPESCNSYNMLKLTRDIFEYHPEGTVMDFFERTLYNHILGTIRPHQNGFVYYTSMSPGSYRTYSTDLNDFWCCVDTGLENHAKYGESIYAHAGNDKLLINLFIASTLDWPEASLRLEQKTAFPEEQDSTLVFHPAAPREMEIAVRYPSWVAPGAFQLLVNGQPQQIDAQPGQYASIRREWREGDTLRIETPMTLHTEMLPHSSDYVATLYGPIVLAGKLGLQGLTAVDFTGQGMAPNKKLAPKEQPVIVQPVSEIVSHLQPEAGEPLTFQSNDLIKPRNVRIVPFYKLVNERYTVYWHVLDTAQWQQQQEQEDAAAVEQRRIDDNTIDTVQANEQQPEVDHQLATDRSQAGKSGDKGWRDAANGGWFSYQMKADDSQPLALACLYWGSDEGGRNFNILVDGTLVASEKLTAAHPGEYYYATYPVPAELVRGKQSITVRFQSKPEEIAGGIFELRTIKAEIGTTSQ